MAALALIRRELVTSLRSTRVLVFTSMLLLGAAVLVLEDWPSSPGARFVYLRGYASSLITTIGAAQFFAGLLLLPGIAGVAITSEREQGTYEMLRATMLGPRSLVLAKSVNALGVYLLLVISGLPILGSIFFLVGVEWQRLITVNAIIVCTALSVVATSVFCSIRLRRTVTSAVASYFAMLCCMGLPIAMLAFGIELLRWSIAPDLTYDPLSVMGGVSHWVLEHLPGYDLSSRFYMDSEDLFSRAMSLFSPALLMAVNVSELDSWVMPGYACGWQLLIAVVFFVKSARRLRREQFDTTPAKPPRQREKPVALPRRFPYYLIDPDKPSVPLSEQGNPMLRKELRWGMLGRATTLVRIFYGMLAFSMLVVAAVGLFSMRTAELVYTGMGLCTIVACLAGPALLASVFTKEYAESNLDMLRMTLLPGERVFRGKLLGGMANFVPLLLPGVAVGFFTLLLLGYPRFEVASFCAYGVTLTTMVTAALVCVACAMVAALVTRQANTAFLTSYILAVLALIGLWFIAGGVASWLFPSPYRVFPDLRTLSMAQRAMYDRFLLARDIANAGSPFIAAGDLVSNLARRGISSESTLGLFLVWLGSIGFFLALSFGLLRFARWRLLVKFKAG